LIRYDHFHDPPLRIEFPGALYHLTARGNAQEPIFLDDRDRQSFLQILEKTLLDGNGNRKVVPLTEAESNSQGDSPR
jgi:hypothetical protein